MVVPALAFFLALAPARAQQASVAAVCLPPGARTPDGFVSCETRCALIESAVDAATPACPKREAAKGGPFFRPLPRRDDTARGLRDAEKKLGEIKAAGFDGQTHEEEKDGVEATFEPAAGVVRAGRFSAPAAGGAATVELKKGAWSAEASGEGLWARGGDGAVLGAYHLEGGVGRKLGDSPVKAIVEAEAERDDLLGVKGAAAVRAGIEAEVVESKHHSLGVAVGVGPDRESSFGGETERFLSPAVALEYAFRALPRLKLGEKLETEFNASNRHDVELKSVTDAVWTVSEKLSLRLSRTLKLRTEPVDGYPGRRSTTLLSVILHP